MLGARPASVNAACSPLARTEHMFYHRPMRAAYREEPCRTALNRVTGMGFRWSLNPYMGCAHRCAFCYVRGFERRAERPSDDRYGQVRVKVNVVEVLRRSSAGAGRRQRWRSGPPPTRISRPRATIGSLAAALRCSPRRERPSTHHSRTHGVARRGPSRRSPRRAPGPGQHQHRHPGPGLGSWLEPGAAPPRQRLRGSGC